MLLRLGVGVVILSAVGIYLAWGHPGNNSVFGPAFGVLSMIGAGMVGLVMVTVAMVLDKR
jgi:hypothetical protein